MAYLRQRLVEDTNRRKNYVFLRTEILYCRSWVVSLGILSRSSIWHHMGFSNGHILLKCATYVLYQHVLSYHAYGGPLANFVKRIVFYFIFFYFCSFVLNKVHMVEKFSNDISCESAHRIRSPYFMYTPRENLSQSCFIHFFFFFAIFIFFIARHLTWYLVKGEL